MVCFFTAPEGKMSEVLRILLALLPLLLILAFTVGRMKWDKRPAAKVYWKKVQEDYMKQLRRDGKIQ